MATIALHSAATGLSALSTQIDVVANNLANVNTVGYKKTRTNFEDLLYLHREQPGVENSEGAVTPAGLEVGLGVRVSNTQHDFRVGSPEETGNDLDVMIDGDGFFRVDIFQEEGTGIGYTRAGNFFLNRDGELVLGNAQGPRVEPSIQIDPTALRVEISPDGTISQILPGQDPDAVGRLDLATFVNPAGLKAIGGNIFVETAASGPAIVGQPGEGNLGSILQGYLETSNVDPVEELIHLIKAQRAFELNSQTIQAADEVMQVVGQLRRF